MGYEPVGEQIPIIEGDASALVLGGPGRGKTVTALAAAQHWLDRHKAGRVIFTSFSNAAVHRLAAASGIRAGSRVQFRTIHSVAMEVLRDYGRFAGLRAPARALDRMEERLVAAERGWPPAEDDAYRGVLEAFARETGQVPFALMLPWATSLLRASSTLRRAVAARHPFIVVDEFQDTSEEQWTFLKLIGEDSRVLALGDEHQMIYGRQFRAILDRFDEFEVWKGIARTILNLPSFRCANREILDFAEDLLHGRRTRASGDGLYLVAVYRAQVRARLALIWAWFRRHCPEGTRLAFLVPSSKKGEELMDALREPEKTHAIPIPIRPRMELDEERADAFALAVYAAADYLAERGDITLKRFAVALETLVALSTRKTLTAAEIESLLSPGRRARSTLRDLLQNRETPSDPEALAPLLLDSMSEDSRFESTAKSVRREGMRRVRSCERRNGSLFEGYRSARQPRMDGHVPSRSRTNMLSMHRCKGREFDYVVMVVDRFAHRANADLGELRRLHYVAATRAKRWLGVVYILNDVGPVLEPVLGR